MQFPESWLREFCSPPVSTERLAEILTMAGLEVEQIQPVAPPFSNVVVGQILEIVKHPNADKLKVCQVDIGDGVPLTIVCGAPNARAGIKVPCAVAGALLPPSGGADSGQKPLLIGKNELRGVSSEGMLCSARELGLSEDHGGLLELQLDAPVGLEIRRHLNLDDSLFTLKLTPNLAHCLSVYGVARELAALTGSPLKKLEFPAVKVGSERVVPVEVVAKDLCGRFSGRAVMNVNPVAETPDWMVDRLVRCGQRPVTALVDISNYVMLELGGPTHIFDLEKIQGPLQVRWARTGESLVLLNGETVALDAKVGVISDEVQVESLAGIMGGLATAVSDSTRHVYIEAAFWWPDAVAGRSRRYNFSTEAGHRFERGVDPQQLLNHLERVTQLIVDICGAADTACGPIDDGESTVPASKPITLRVARASKVLGMPVAQDRCSEVLRSLELQVDEHDGWLTVTPPSYRFDLLIEEDLIEEIVRFIGYENLPDSPPLAPVTARLERESRRSGFAVRRQLAAIGYQETINFSFVDQRLENELLGNASPIKLLNPISSQMGVMRSSLLGSLLQALKFNVDRKASRVNLFEVGRVFCRDATVADTNTTVAGFNQPLMVAGVAYGSRHLLQWGAVEKAVDFYDVKGDVEDLLSPSEACFEPATHPAMHPGRCARVLMGGENVGFIGELHPKWRQKYELVHAPILFELKLNAVLARPVPVFSPVTKLQPVERDLAVIVSDTVTHAELMAAVHAAGIDALLKSVTLFDIYRPQHGNPLIPVGEKSMAIRLTLANDETSLGDAVIDAAMTKVLLSLQSQLNARLRG